MAIPQNTANTLIDKALPYTDAAAIVVATPFPVAEAIYIGVGGNITVTMESGASVVFTGVLTGQVLTIRCTNVSSATANNLVALYR